MPASITPDTAHRLQGWYGCQLPSLLSTFTEGDSQRIPGTPYLWGEIAWALEQEHVLHLEDLLLRRTRLGLLLPDGGVAHRERLREFAVNRCGWTGDQFDAEWQSYTNLWRPCYAPQPFREGAPMPEVTS